MNPPPLKLSDLVHQALTQYLDDLDGEPPQRLYELVMGEVEKPLLATVLKRLGGNQSAAALCLGISRSTLRKKLARYNML